MNQDMVEVQGTLQADGTLVLDEKPNLAPGRVDVVLRKVAVPSPPQEDWWQFMQRACMRTLYTSRNAARDSSASFCATSFALAGGFVEREIAHHHFAERPEVRIETRWRRESVTPADA